MRQLAGTLTAPRLLKAHLHHEGKKEDSFSFWSCCVPGSVSTQHLQSQKINLFWIKTHWGILWEATAGSGSFPLLHLLNKTFNHEQSFPVVGSGSSYTQSQQVKPTVIRARVCKTNEKFNANRYKCLPSHWAYSLNLVGTAKTDKTCRKGTIFFKAAVSLLYFISDTISVSSAQHKL